MPNIISWDNINQDVDSLSPSLTKVDNDRYKRDEYGNWVDTLDGTTHRRNPLGSKEVKFEKRARPARLGRPEIR